MDIAKALADPIRLRMLALLQRGGELCLCQLVTVLDAAPSTTSQHLRLLDRAGLVAWRKDGRWRHYRLVGRQAEPSVRQALRWALRSVANDPQTERDARRLKQIASRDLEQLSACCYGTRT